MDSVRDGKRVRGDGPAQGWNRVGRRPWRLEPVQVYATARLDPTGSRKRPQWGEKASGRSWPIAAISQFLSKLATALKINKYTNSPATWFNRMAVCWRALYGMFELGLATDYGSSR